MEALHDRLRAAIYDHWQRDDGRVGSIRHFQKQLQQRLGRGSRGSGPGTSYPSIESYLKGKSEPSIGFLREAARLTGVRETWLITGEGQPTAETHEAWLQQQIHQLARAVDEDTIAAFVASLDAGDGLRAPHRQAATLRFARKLHDADFPRAVWFGAEERRTLLREVMQFLVWTDRFFDPQHSKVTKKTTSERLNLLESMLLRRSASDGWAVTWYDAVLDLFARRVYGLGVRSGTPADAHAPTGSRSHGAQLLMREPGAEEEEKEAIESD